MDISTKDCCGCGMCAMICSRNAIEIKYDTGFPLPAIDEKKCIKCGRCYAYCPTNLSLRKNNDVLAYGGWSLNENNRMLSTSGGIAYEIARHLVENGFKYMGVRFNNEKLCAENYTTDKIELLNASRGSKYITSRTLPALNDLKQKSKWVVFGTPCQIAAIDNYANLEGRREDYVLVDMFCAGPPTDKLLLKYLEEECNKDNKQLKHIIDVKFRDKSKFGWSSTMRIDYNDGTTNNIVYKNESYFYKLFYSGATAKDACYKCMYAKDISRADIRLGDYSGGKYDGNYEGVSAILVFSEKGKKIINELRETKIYLEETTCEDINKTKLVKPKYEPRQRKKILEDLDTDMSLEEIYNKYVKQIMFEKRVKKKIKRILGYLTNRN